MTYAPRKILAFDTSGPHVAASLWPYPHLTRYEEMARGQAEALMPICSELLAEARLTPADLEAIAVGVGPGNFTGIRIAVSAARGMALALGIPAVGVTGFELLHKGRGWSGRVMVSLPAPRGGAYVQTFINGLPVSDPGLTTPGIRETHLEQPNLIVAGYRAKDIAEPYNAEWNEECWNERHIATTASKLAQIAHDKLDAAGWNWDARPAPLYVRPADAAPPREAPPVILP